MEKTFNNDVTVGQIVTRDFRAAEIFKNAGIDFCCGGNKSISDACREKGIDPSKIEQELIDLDKLPGDQSKNFNGWDLDFLCDYIINTHHKYLLKSLPELRFYTSKIASVHGDSHPELIEVLEIFSKVNDELLQHLTKEEEVLFPAIKRLLKSDDIGDKNLIKSEITRMSGEHEFAGDAMDRIRKLTQNYLVPEDACNTYRVSLKLLEQFEDDLHVHVHIENNILYPKALMLNY